MKSYLKHFLYWALSLTSWFERLSESYLLHRKTITIRFSDRTRQGYLEKIEAVNRATTMILQPYESYMICESVCSTGKFAEAWPKLAYIAADPPNSSAN